MADLKEYIRLRRAKDFPIYHIQFSHQHNLCWSLIRPYSYSCVPKFRGNLFSMDACIHWFGLERKGATGCFEYDSEVLGFTLDSMTIQSFYRSFSDISDREWSVFDLLFDVDIWNDPFYLIATFNCGNEEKSIIEHELWHCFYHIFPEYRKEIIAEVKKTKGIKRFINHLLKNGYAFDRIEDELQAYAQDTFEFMDKKVVNKATINFGEKIRKIGRSYVVAKIDNLFDDYIKTETIRI